MFGTRRFSKVLAWMAVGLCWSVAGCASYPPVAEDNQRLISSLRTALSVRSPDWLRDNVTAIESRRAAGRMSDEEYEAFQAIIATAEAGDWERAERDSLRFQKAQRPTAEQIGRLVPAAVE